MDKAGLGPLTKRRKTYGDGLQDLNPVCSFGKAMDQEVL